MGDSLWIDSSGVAERPTHWIGTVENVLQAAILYKGISRGSVEEAAPRIRML